MSKERKEELFVGVGALIWGIFLIAIGIAIHEKLWFTVIMVICGTLFADRAWLYLEEKLGKRGH